MRGNDDDGYIIIIIRRLNSYSVMTIVLSSHIFNIFQARRPWVKRQPWCLTPDDIIAAFQSPPPIVFISLLPSYWVILSISPPATPSSILSIITLYLHPLLDICLSLSLWMLSSLTPIIVVAIIASSSTTPFRWRCSWRCWLRYSPYSSLILRRHVITSIIIIKTITVNITIIINRQCHKYHRPRHQPISFLPVQSSTCLRRRLPSWSIACS